MESLWSLCGVFVEALWSLCGVFVESLRSLCGVVVEDLSQRISMHNARLLFNL